MKAEFECKRCWRRAGGISIGVAYHFPTSIIDAPDERLTYRSLVIGLVAWQITVGITTKGGRYAFD